MIDLSEKILCMAGKLRYSALRASFNAATIFIHSRRCRVEVLHRREKEVHTRAMDEL